MISRTLAGVATAFVAVATAAHAQDVRVRLVDEESHQPLGGLLVAALGERDAVGPTVLTSSSGIAVVRMPDGAPHRLLVRHIGFAPVTTSPVAADTTGAITEIVVHAERITLGTVRVVGTPGCSSQAVSPSANAEAAWNAVRDALEASTLTRNQRLVTTAPVRFHRQLRTDGTVDFADSTALGRSGERPFVAPAPAALERDGYFKTHDDNSESFYAPDEAVILSPGFTQHHCVSVYPDVRHDSSGTLVALSFVPRDRDTRPEIKGLIWIDSATSELRRVDFEYVRVPLPAPADSLGGSVEFQHLASGAWIVSGWRLRIPRWRVIDRRRMYVVLDGYSEDGGFTTVVRDLVTPGPSVPRTIRGTVYDSIAGRPLAGAHVHLTNSDRNAVTDSVGAFRLDSVGIGVHTVWADHPALDSLGIFSVSADVDATPQAVTDAVLAAPSFLTMWARACGKARHPGTRLGFVFGTVHTDSIIAPGGATEVDVEWGATAKDGSASARVSVAADSVGNFTVCGVPVDHPFRISATHGDAATVPVSLDLSAARVARRDLTFPSAASNIVEAVVDAGGRGVGTPHVLRVLSLDGKPVAYANVSVAGGTIRITDERGEVALGRGNVHGVATNVRRIGFAPWFGTIDFPDTSSVATVTLSRIAQNLAEMRITGQKNPSSPFVQGFYDRWLMRQKGLLSATFIGPEELEFRHPDHITNMLRGLPGVRMKPIGDLGDMFQVLLSDQTDFNCQMAIVLDGKQVYPEPVPNVKSIPPLYVVFINQVIAAEQIMAIEVYPRGGNMPIGLQVNDTRCGVVAFWTGSRK